MDDDDTTAIPLRDARARAPDPQAQAQLLLRLADAHPDVDGADALRRAARTVRFHDRLARRRRRREAGR